MHILSPNDLLIGKDGEIEQENSQQLKISSPSGVKLTNGLTSVSIKSKREISESSINSASAAARIKSSLNSESDTNHFTYTNNHGSYISNWIKENGVIVNTSEFVIRDSSGKVNFLIDEKNKQMITSNTICLKKQSSIRLNCSLQTPFIWPSNITSDLKIESISRNVKFLAPTSIQISNSNLSNGKINLFSFGKMNLKSKKGPNSGQIVLNSTSVKLINLPSIFPSERGSQYPHIMQLCMCPISGKLYLAKPDSICTFDQEICTKV